MSLIRARQVRFVTLALAAGLLASVLLPGVGAALTPQNDAGSHRDAPNSPDSDFRIDRGVVYTGTQEPATDQHDFYAFAGVAGETVRADLAGSPLCLAHLYDADGELERYCGVGSGGTFYEWVVRATGDLYLDIFTFGGAYAFSVGDSALADPAGGVGDTAPNALLEGPADGCPEAPAAEAAATHGAGDGAFPTLAWAALKTGFRAAVAWSTPVAEIGKLTVDLGGESLVLSELAPRTQHLFILDELPLGGVLCFRASTPSGQGDAHAVLLRNAMTSFDGSSYTANLLILANEQVVLREHVTSGLDEFARGLWDSTDGHVRAGAILVAFGDVAHHNSGWATCYTAGSLVVQHGAPCETGVDAIWTNDAYPAGAASTYIDGIQEPTVSMWMNWYWQGVPAADVPGHVLLHEFGHYAFGAMDLYGGDQGCSVPAARISIMGSGRSATEFDDDIVPCPDAASIPGYVPSWVLLRDRFPMVPHRPAGPVVGPSGDGGAYHLHAYHAVWMPGTVCLPNGMPELSKGDGDGDGVPALYVSDGDDYNVGGQFPIAGSAPHDGRCHVAGDPDDDGEARLPAGVVLVGDMTLCVPTAKVKPHDSDGDHVSALYTHGKGKAVTIHSDGSVSPGGWRGPCWLAGDLDDDGRHRPA